jgi:sec-independent protein translocase protein TatA
LGQSYLLSSVLHTSSEWNGATRDIILESTPLKTRTIKRYASGRKEIRFMPLGWQELMIVLIIVVIIFGAGKLPEIGGAVGKSIKEFKKESEELEGSLSSETESAEPIKSDSPKVIDTRQVRADEI